MKIENSGILLDILYRIYPESSKKKVKGFLKSGCVYVNGKQITQYDFLVREGSRIEIRKENKTHKKSPLPILFEDDTFLVIDKPAGLLSIGTEKEKRKTAYHQMRLFVNARGRGEKLFILHRLDRETSGVLVFVKDERVKHLLQEKWNQLEKERSYVAVVEGVSKEEDTLCFSLEEGKDLKMHVVPKGKGKGSVTQYQCLQKSKQRSLLKIALKTGRKNQIRASLSHVNLPILGDRKYGSIKKEKRVYLHADCLSLEHPITHKIYRFESKVPRTFYKVL